jgi:hypothetical protein
MEVTILHIDDWEVFYLDDKCIHQSHGLDWGLVFEEMVKKGEPITKYSVGFIDDEEEDSVLEQYGYRFPESLSKFDMSVLNFPLSIYPRPVADSGESE